MLLRCTKWAKVLYPDVCIGVLQTRTFRRRQNAELLIENNTFRSECYMIVVISFKYNNTL